jgi:hypothetical protein
MQANEASGAVSLHCIAIVARAKQIARFQRNATIVLARRCYIELSLSASRNVNLAYRGREQGLSSLPNLHISLLAWRAPIR